MIPTPVPTPTVTPMLMNYAPPLESLDFALSDKKVFMRVFSNGSVEFQTGMAPDEASRAFWEVVKSNWPQVCGIRKY